MSTPATVVMSQSNGAGETPTDGISSLSFGSADIPNMVPANYPLVIPASGSVHSYQTFTRWKVTAWVDTNTINNCKWFKSAGTNAANWVEQYWDDGAGTTYFTPNRTGTGGGTQATPWVSTAIGARPLPGTISNPTVGYFQTKYNVHMIDFPSTGAAGAKGSHTITFRYDEA